MDVHPQNTWPSLRFDVKAANGLVGRFLAAGFYYKTFIKPRAAVARLRSRSSSGSAAGGRRPGHRPPRATSTSATPTPTCWWRAADRRGWRPRSRRPRPGRAVLLVEEEHELGGHLRWGDEARAGAPAPSCGPRCRARAGHRGHDRLRRDRAATTTTGSASCSAAFRNVAERLVKARAGTLVVAPGLIERPVRVRGQRPARRDALRPPCGA